MSIATIELNDVAIRIDSESGTSLSPGYAVVDGDRLLIGEAGLANARLLPRWRNNRFWQSLDTNPLNEATPSIRHHADLVFSHLESLADQIKQQSGLILLVPSDYTGEQLGLLLGITRELGLPVSAMLDEGVAAGLNASLPRAIYVEIYQHRWVMTTMTTGQHIQRTNSQTIGNRGWSSLMDQWAALLANRFIAEHRYDPAHQAASEQQLYDRIPLWLSDPDTPPSLDVGEALRTITISEAEWQSVCSDQIANVTRVITDHIDSAKSSDSIEILLGPQAGSVPGLARSLELIDSANVTALAQDATSALVRSHGETIASLSSDVTHIVQLPISNENSPHTPQASPVTHLLGGYSALRIDSNLDISGVANGKPVSGDSPAFSLVRHGSRTFLDPHEPVSLNGSPTRESTEVAPGDVITLNDCDLLLISDA